MKPDLTRRTLLFMPAAAAAAARSSWLKSLQSSASRVIGPKGDPLPEIEVLRRWKGPLCTIRLRNRSALSRRVREAIIFDLHDNLSPAMPMYAEGFQMLSQTGGTLGKPVDIGAYTDAKHYRLPQTPGAFTAYNLVRLETSPATSLLLAFTSCRRFSGMFHLRPSSIEVSLDIENLELAPGQTIDTEEFGVFEGANDSPLFEQLADRLRANHPPIFPAHPPQGWCSWYCFGPTVTAQQVIENLDFIAKHMPALRYIQIDDGYQAAMGDWLETGKAFGGDVRAVLRQIRQRGFEPAIWVAPFIAEEESQVFQKHPGWFMMDEKNQPLSSDKVTFGGWRRGPWYALDCTHPEVPQHIENVFRTMRQDWGVTYFKLDGTFWGAMHGARLHDPQATRIQAYRRGMEAIRKGAGDAFILAGNHPLWPSLGVIQGSRASNDIERIWNRLRQVARETLSRGWQNGRLWWNDPDCVTLSGSLPDNEYHFHAAAIYASGGLLLSGDDLPRLPAARLEMLRRLSPPTGGSPQFDPGLRIGRLKQPNRELIFFFNWSEQPETFETTVPPTAVVKDFWSGTAVAAPGGKLRIAGVRPHSARILTL